MPIRNLFNFYKDLDIQKLKRQRISVNSFPFVSIFPIIFKFCYILFEHSSFSYAGVDS